MWEEYRFPVVDMDRDLGGRIVNLEQRHIAVAPNRESARSGNWNGLGAGIDDNLIIKRAGGEGGKAWISERDSRHGTSTSYRPETKRTVPFWNMFGKFVTDTAAAVRQENPMVELEALM